MLRIKICGITRPEDALLAENAGAWALGFIFAKNTPRFITPESACEIINRLSENIQKVGVFVNSTLEEVTKISKRAGLTKIQLHGEESAEFCTEAASLTGKEVIKAFRIRDEKDLEQINSYKKVISYILLDTYSETRHGGTGKTFDWQIAQKAHCYDLPLILAGGLTPGSIIPAYEQVKPFALDLSSGLEKSKGIKDSEKIAQIKNLSQKINKKQ